MRQVSQYHKLPENKLQVQKPTRLRVYMSGPISNGGKATPFERRANAVFAAQVMFDLMKRGFAVLCPQLTEYAERSTGRKQTHKEWLENDYPWVYVSDAVLRLPGDSTGSDMETQFADTHGIPVFRTQRDLYAWAASKHDDRHNWKPIESHNGQASKQETVTFETGAVRSSDADNERYDLISPIGLRRLAETYAEGARKYSDNNWLKGFPISTVINHALRHFRLYLAGDKSEDHLAHGAWNIFAAMHFEETRADLMDIPARLGPLTDPAIDEGDDNDSPGEDEAE